MIGPVLISNVVFGAKRPYSSIPLAIPTGNVITGYNTDIEFDGVTYHVQTEDKGLGTPMIMSLVYDRGTILASKRQPYNDLIEAGFDEKLLIDRLTKQHKTICAAVKKGRIDDLRKLSKSDTKKAAKKVEAEPLVLASPPQVSNGSKAKAKPSALDLLETNFEAPPIDRPLGDDGTPPIPMPKDAFRSKVEKAPEPVIEAVTVLDVSEVVPIEAVRVVSDLAGTERPENSKLSLELIGGDRFSGGTNCTVTIMICRGARVVEGAEVMVKVLGSSFCPLIFHSRTDQNGISNVALQLPSFNNGRASVLVRAISQGEEVELRRAVAHS